MNRRSHRAIAIPATLSALALLGAVGCSSSNPVHALRTNPTPEVRTLADTSDEVQNKLWLTQNMNVREFWEDAARTFYLDRPTRLSPYPIPE